MASFLTDQEFTLIKELIYEQSGLHFHNSNRMILESRLRERLKATGLASVEEYHRMILKDPEEMKVLLDAVTTNLTRFFRNSGHFAVLEKHVLPDLVRLKRERRQNRLKVWSAGCATGEEPFSVAMVLLEHCPQDIKFEIVASDLSLRSLMTAQEAFYPESRIGGVPEPYLGKYFEKKREGYHVKDEVRRTVKFDYHNLKFESGQKDVDIVFCRNVLIYFDVEAQKAVVDRFFRAMTDHSYLFIGHSESLFGMESRFQFIKTEWSTLYARIGGEREARG